MDALLRDDCRTAAVDVLHAATGIFTAEPVVCDLLQRLGWPAERGRLFDPGCGDGAFLAAAVQLLAPAPGDFDTCRRVLGWEIHPRAVAAARDRIEIVLARHGWWHSDAEIAARMMVLERDFLVDTVGERFDCIAGNPPYIRFGFLPDYFKDVYASAVAAHAKGDLLHAFVDRCASILEPGGAIGMVTSDRWLGNESTAGLRSALGQRLGMSYLARLDPDSAFYRPKYRQKGSPPRVHPVAFVLEDSETADLLMGAAPINPDSFGSATGEPYTGTTLGDIAQVRLAPWLGPKGLFVIDAGTAAALSPEDRLSLIPAADTDCIPPKEDVFVAPTQFAIRTNRAEEPTGWIRNHLLANRDKVPVSRKGVGRPWWLPPETINLDTSESTLLVPRIARRIRVIEIPPGVLPINHNLTVCSALPGMSLLELRGLLLSDASQAWIRSNAPRLENGFVSITTRLLRRMPVTAPGTRH